MRLFNIIELAKQYVILGLILAVIIGIIAAVYGAAGHWYRTFRGHAVPDHRKMVAGFISRAFAGIYRGTILYPGREPEENAGSRKYPSVKKPGGEKHGKRDSPENRTYEYCFYPV